MKRERERRLRLTLFAVSPERSAIIRDLSLSLHVAPRESSQSHKRRSIDCDPLSRNGNSIASPSSLPFFFSCDRNVSLRMPRASPLSPIPLPPLPLRLSSSIKVGHGPIYRTLSTSAVRRFAGARTVRLINFSRTPAEGHARALAIIVIDGEKKNLRAHRLKRGEEQKLETRKESKTTSSLTDSRYARVTLSLGEQTNKQINKL